MAHPHQPSPELQPEQDRLLDVGTLSTGRVEGDVEHEPLFDEGVGEESSLSELLGEARERGERLEREYADRRRAQALSRLAQLDRAALRELRESGRLEEMSADELWRFIDERDVDAGIRRETRDAFARRTREATKLGMEKVRDVNIARREPYEKAQSTWRELVDVCDLLDGEKIGPWYKPWARISFVGRVPDEFDGTTVGLEMDDHTYERARAWFEKKGDTEGVELLDRYNTLMAKLRGEIQRFDEAGMAREGLAAERRAARVERPSRRPSGSAEPVKPPVERYESARERLNELFEREGIRLDPDHRAALLQDDWLVVNVAEGGRDLVQVANEQIVDLEHFLRRNGVTFDVEGNVNQRQLSHVLRVNPNALLDHAGSVLPALYALVEQRLGPRVDRLPRQVASSEPFAQMAEHRREALEKRAGVVRDEKGGADNLAIETGYLREAAGPERTSRERAKDYLADIQMDEEYKRALSHDTQFAALIREHDGDVKAAAHAFREVLRAEMAKDGIVVDDVDYTFDVRTARRIMSKPVADFYALLFAGANELIQTLTAPTVSRERLRGRFDARKAGRLAAPRTPDVSELDRPEAPYGAFEESEDAVIGAVEKLDAFVKQHAVDDDQAIYLYDHRFIDALVEAGSLWEGSGKALRDVEGAMQAQGLAFKSDGSVDGRTLRRVRNEMAARGESTQTVDEDVNFHGALLALRERLKMTR